MASPGDAELFRALHVPGDPLVLPNAWDAASACIAVAAGARAVATSSAGVSWTLGHGDGSRLGRDLALDAIARITGVVEVPVTADVESGYAAAPDGVAQTVRGALAAGVVGINLEDSLRPVDEQAERIAAARRAADDAGLPLFVNARIDTHRLLADPAADWLGETCVRARAYAAAGADGVFVLGALAPDAIGALVEAVTLPVNVTTGPGQLGVRELAGLGVARVSAGSAIAEAAYGLADRAARELITSGTTDALAGGLSWAELNGLFPDHG